MSMTDAASRHQSNGPTAAVWPAWSIRVLFDGECPLCAREINWLRRLDRRGAISFVDIADPTFEPSAFGVSHEHLMARIHGQLPDGSLIEGVEVLRRLYEAVGLTWLVAPTRWPGVAALVDWGYRVFARHRLRLTGRCSSDRCRPPSAQEITP